MLIKNFNIEVNRKQVKNINLKVYPDLTIKASIPENMDISTVERMIIYKEDWINNQLKRYKEQNRMAKRSYVSGEDHYLNGKRYILKVCDSNTPMIKIENNNTMMMYVRKSSSVENKERLMNYFYKKNLENKLKKFIPLWEDKIGVKSNCYSIRKMKNKWGSCNTDKKEINFNLELAKKKDSEIQYVVIHELLHLIERNHNENFRKLMYNFCPKWELYRETLNEIL